MNALADTGENVSVFPYCLFMNLGLGDPKPYNSKLTMANNTQAKAIGEVKNAYLDNFAQEEEDDWLSCFEVGRDEDGNPKYRPVAPLFLDIEDDMERALAMEAYFNPFKNIIVFKKLIDFLGSLPKATQSLHPNPLIANFEKRNKQGTIEYHLQQVKNYNLKWRELPSAERHAYCERLSKLQAEHLCKHAPSLKENSLICRRHYVTKIAHSLGYLNEVEVAKCSKPIEYETWIVKMLANELDETNHTLMQNEQEAPQLG
nr:hypothetical protein [Tanacetum cinerariifolium]